MNTCRTCIHWHTDPNDRGTRRLTNPEDPDTYEEMVMPFEVRCCAHPKLLFFERPLEANGFAVADGSDYLAVLLTAEDFGCIRHEEKP